MPEALEGVYSGAWGLSGSGGLAEGKGVGAFLQFYGFRVPGSSKAVCRCKILVQC